MLALPGEDRTIALAADLPPLAAPVTIDFGVGRGSVTMTGAAMMLARGGLVMTLAPQRRVVVDLVMAGEGGLTLAGGGTLVLARAARYRGGTTIAAGTLRLERGGALPPDGRLVLAGGAFELGGADSQLGGLAGNGAIGLGDRTLTVDQDGDTAFSGPISGAGRLVKDGPGRLTLATPQAWTGGTMVAGGVLELAAGGLHLSGPIEVKGGSLIAPGLTIGSGKR
jgi:autotransporter-associated beta strand protein